MKKKISTTLNTENIDSVIHLLSEISSKLDEAIIGRTENEHRLNPSSGNRSATEILAHMLHCEARSSEAIYLALMSKNPLVHKIHPERDWGKLLRYDQLSFGELRQYFQTRRTMLLHVLNPLTEKQWGRTIREEGKKRQESVYWQARGLALHDVEHIEEIKHLFFSGH